jgi:hypothetical protein
VAKVRWINDLLMDSVHEARIHDLGPERGEAVERDLEN